ncbi:MAG: hypothetical protein JOZ88_07600 [Hyphomicrobiales bacterium]|nr:hypothetical protein [Hyphomicrobiales bacterium]
MKTDDLLLTYAVYFTPLVGALLITLFIRWQARSLNLAQKQKQKQKQKQVGKPPGVLGDLDVEGSYRIARSISKHARKIEQDATRLMAR